jgi:hypothetical protein
MEVLTAYVRENAPWPPTQPKDAPSSKGDQLLRKDPSAKPDADIQAILTVLGRRTPTTGEDEYQPRLLSKLNLGETDLRGADLLGAGLQGADLMAAQLQGARLVRADLRRARNLTVEQLSTARTLYQALFDPPFQEQIQWQYPELLEGPQK